MRHFLAQFGPALQWPWTKLTDVPELTDELLDRIVAQSDEQADGMGVREMERLRDDCLVAVLQALRSQGVGAGEVLARHERSLLGGVSGGADVGERGRRGAAAAPRPGAAGVGRLQRPCPREPLPAGVRRLHRRSAAPARRGCRLPGRWPQLLHRGDASVPPRRGLRRRRSRRHHPAAGGRRQAAARLPPHDRRRRRRRCSPPPNRCCCTSTPSTAGRRRPAANCWRGCGSWPRGTPPFRCLTGPAGSIGMQQRRSA